MENHLNIHHHIDELLEDLWMAREGEKSISYDPQNPIHTQAVSEGMVQVDRGILVFTGEGEMKAEGIIRRHRLAEVLFHQVMQLTLEVSTSSACEMEHILSEEVTDAVCTFLGHPPVCPHGNPIPKGKCCKSAKKELFPLLFPLSQAPLGKPLKIAYILTKDKTMLSHFANYGLMPGERVRLVQRNPSYIVKIGEMSIAIEKKVAETIFVRILE